MFLAAQHPAILFSEFSLFLLFDIFVVEILLQFFFCVFLAVGCPASVVVLTFGVFLTFASHTGRILVFASHFIVDFIRTAVFSASFWVRRLFCVCVCVVI